MQENTSTNSGAGQPTPNAMLQVQVQQFMQQMSDVGDGNLQARSEVTPDTMGVLIDTFNHTTEELAKLIHPIQSLALQVTDATQGIAKMTNQKDANVNEITSKVSELAKLAEQLQTSVSVFQLPKAQ